DRYDEAQKILEKVARGFGIRRAHRALALQNLAAIEVRRGNYEVGLRLQREALAQYAKLMRKRVSSQLVMYGELGTLVNLGRVGEARQPLSSRRPKVPAGDLLRLRHWTSELYISLAEGAHRIGEDDLHERVRVGLRMSASEVLLGLLAWAHAESGH